MMTRALEIYVDGACSGNPGPAAIGVVIREHGIIIQTIGESIGSATNNIAEYSALIRALEVAHTLKAQEVTLRTDSQLVYRQVIGQYKVRNEKLQGLCRRAQTLLKDFSAVDFKHIPREQNKEADQLASSSVQKSI